MVAVGARVEQDLEVLGRLGEGDGRDAGKGDGQQEEQLRSHGEGRPIAPRRRSRANHELCNSMDLNCDCMTRREARANEPASPGILKPCNLVIVKS